MIEDAAEEQLLLLADVDILREVPQGEVDYVATCSQVVRLGKRESLTLGEGLLRGLLLLVSGRVRVHEPSAVGPGLTFSLVEGGTVIGPTGNTPQPSRILSVQALEPSVLRVLGWEDFDKLVLRTPKVAVRTIRLLSERLATYENRLSDQIRKEVPARLAGLIFRLSEPRGLVADENNRRIPARYTHQQLASLVGAHREAVTRALGELKRAGIVEVREQRIHVTDLEALRRAAYRES